MSKQKSIKISIAVVIISLLILNLTTLNVVSSNDKQIQSLMAENDAIKTRLEYISNEIPRLDKGLANTYGVGNINKSVLKKLINKLDNYDYIEPITVWGDENEVIDFSR